MLSMFREKKGFSVLFPNSNDEVKGSEDHTPRTLRPTSSRHLSAQTNLNRCQRCGKNFQALVNSSQPSCVCLRCNFPVCQFCCQSVDESNARLCCICAKSFSFMKLFGKTSYGSDLVVRVLAYCDARAGRIIKSFFPSVIARLSKDTGVKYPVLPLEEEEEELRRNSVLLSKIEGTSCVMTHPFSIDHSHKTDAMLSSEENSAKQPQPRPCGVLQLNSCSQTNQQEPLTRTPTTHRDVCAKGIHLFHEKGSPAHNAVKNIENSPLARQTVWEADPGVNDNMVPLNMYSSSRSLPNDTKLRPSGHLNLSCAFERELTFTSHTVSVSSEVHTRPACCDGEPLSGLAPMKLELVTLKNSTPKNPSNGAFLVGRVSSGSESFPSEWNRSISPAPRFPAYEQFLDEQKKTLDNRCSDDCLVTVSPVSDEVIVMLGAKRVSGGNLTLSGVTKCETVSASLRYSQLLQGEKKSSKKKAKRNMSNKASGSIEPRISIPHPTPHRGQDATAAPLAIPGLGRSVRSSENFKSRLSDSLIYHSTAGPTVLPTLRFCRQKIVSISPEPSNSSAFLRRHRVSHSGPRALSRRSASRRDQPPNLQREKTRAKISKRLSPNLCVNTNLLHGIQSKNYALLRDYIHPHRDLGDRSPCPTATARLPNTRAKCLGQTTQLTLPNTSIDLDLVGHSSTGKKQPAETSLTPPHRLATSSIVKKQLVTASPQKREISSHRRITRTRSAFTPLVRIHSAVVHAQPFARVATAIQSTTPPGRLARSNSATATRGRGLTKHVVSASSVANGRPVSPYMTGYTTPRRTTPSARLYKNPRFAEAARAETTNNTPLAQLGISPFRRTNTTNPILSFERKASRAKVNSELPRTPVRPESTARVKSVTKLYPQVKQSNTAPVPVLIHTTGPSKGQSGRAINLNDNKVQPKSLGTALFADTPRRQYIFTRVQNTPSAKSITEALTHHRYRPGPALSTNVSKTYSNANSTKPLTRESLSSDTHTKVTVGKAKPKSNTAAAGGSLTQKTIPLQTISYPTKPTVPSSRNAKVVGKVYTLSS